MAVSFGEDQNVRPLMLDEKEIQAFPYPDGVFPRSREAADPFYAKACGYGVSYPECGAQDRLGPGHDHIPRLER